MSKKKVRNSNIELLRIFSMLFIIMGHLVDQTSFLSKEMTLDNAFITFEGMGARIATNIFLIISVWFLVDDVVGASKAVLRIYKEEFLKEQLVKQGLEDVYRRFNVKRVSEEHERLFETIQNMIV